LIKIESLVNIPVSRPRVSDCR